MGLPGLPVPWNFAKGKGDGSSKIRPAPQFPSDLGAESYKSWRMKFIHWMAQAIKMNIDEGLMGNELLTSMAKANSTAQHIVARMAPQDLASSGQAPNPWTGFPGAPSGVRMALARLDRRYRRELEDEELKALEEFYATERRGKMTEYLEEFETRGEEAAIRSGLALSASSLSWHLIKGARLSPLQRMLLMSQVGGDLRRYGDITYLLKNCLLYTSPSPRDS